MSKHQFNDGQCGNKNTSKFTLFQGSEAQSDVQTVISSYNVICGQSCKDLNSMTPWLLSNHQTKNKGKGQNESCHTAADLRNVCDGVCVTL